MPVWPYVVAALGVVTLRGRKRPSGPYPPARPRDLVYPTSSQRDQWFGPVKWRHTPTPDNPEHVDVDRAPPMRQVQIPELGRVAHMHEVAAGPLSLVLADLRDDGKASKLLRTWSGSYVPRLVRGSKTTLSSHSYGTALDLNAPQAPLGTIGDPEQWELAVYFVRRGWYWGGWFRERPDPHHFEWIKPAAPELVA